MQPSPAMFVTKKLWHHKNMRKYWLIKTRVRNDRESVCLFFFPHFRIHNEVADKMGPAGSAPLGVNMRFNVLKLLPLANFSVII